MSALEELETTVRTVAEQVGPAVVGIGRGWGVGSGIVVAAGQVLTNAHNVAQEDVSVTFADGRTADGRLAGTDVDGDLAVITTDTGDVAPIVWGEADAAIGRAVFALSNPGGRGVRATFGMVSATDRAFRGPRGRRISGSIEHNAPLPRGSSGGPLVDAAGRLLGINTNRLGEGFYLAIVADADLRGRVDALSRGERRIPPRLGVAIAPPRAAQRMRAAVGLPPRDGLLVSAVEEGGPADRAGVRRGDLIVAAAGRPLATPDDLFTVLDALAPGASLPLHVVRGVEEVDLEVAFPGT